MLIVARILQGFGAALMFPQTLTGIQLSFSGAQRARAIGLYAIALSGGAVAGQILGGALVSANLLDSQWRSIFFVNVPVGVAVLAPARATCRVRRSAPRGGSMSQA
jgi:MFS family permease